MAVEPQVPDRSVERYCFTKPYKIKYFDYFFQYLLTIMSQQSIIACHDTGP